MLQPDQNSEKTENQLGLFERPSWLDVLPFAHLIVGRESVLAANKEACKLLRVKEEEELQQLSWLDLLPDREGELGNEHQLQKGELILADHHRVHEIRLRCIDGFILPVQVKVSFLEGFGEPAWLIGVKDLTASKKTERALRAERQRLRRAEEIAHIGHWRWVVGDKSISWSPEVYRIHGYDPGTVDITLDKALGAYHPDDRAIVDTYIQDAVQENVSFEFVLRIIRPNGDIRYIRSRGECEVDTLGNTYAVFGTVQDITDEILLQKQLSAVQQRFKDVVEETGNFVWEIDTSGRFVYLSDNVEEILGYNQADMVGHTLFDFIAIHDRDEVTNWYKNQVELQENFEQLEVRSITSIGNEVWLRLGGAPVYSDEKFIGYRGIGSDVTQALREEKNLREQRERLEYAVTGASDGIWDWDLETNQVYYSPVWFRMLGYDSDEFPNTLDTWSQLLHVDDMPVAQRAVHDHLEGLTESYKVAFRMQHKKGHHVWVEARGKAIKNEKGVPIRFVGVHTLIQEKKEQEEKLEKARQMAEVASLSKSEFLANMSHEIRTPMNAILGMADLLMMTELDNQQSKYCQVLTSSADVLLSLINDILDLAKVESGKIELELMPVDLREIIQHCLDLFSGKASEKNLVLQMECEDQLPTRLMADPTRLRQILNNLISNAIKFTEQGHVRVLAEVLQNDGQECLLRIAVEDSGVGIEDSALERIFDVFDQADTSVTRKYGGTGLGLTICRRLTELMRGELKVRSQVDVGTTFSLNIPFALPQEKVVDQEELAGVDGQGLYVTDTSNESQQQLKILVIEDILTNQMVIKAFLNRIGYEPDIVNDGAEGVEAIKKHNYDMIFVDLQMPIKDGFQTTKEIHEIYNERSGARPKIVALTAHAMAGDKERCLEAGMDDYLTKPLQLEKLKDVIKRQLAA